MKKGKKIKAHLARRRDTYNAEPKKGDLGLNRPGSQNLRKQ